MKILFLASSFIAIVVWTSIAWTQDGPGDQPPYLTIRPGPMVDGPGPAIPGSGGREGAGIMRSRTVSRTINETVYEAVPPEELAEHQAFQQAKQTLKDVKTDAERQKAMETIQQHLEKQFEKDMAQREQDLAAIEERVKLLRQQLSKRQVAKNEIISLRLKTIVNNAEGLGFPGEDGPQADAFGPPRTSSSPVQVRGAAAIPARGRESNNKPGAR